MSEEALENLTREEDVLAEEAPETEVVELPPNVQRLQEKQELLRQEIGNLTTQVNQLVAELETRQLAFNQCTALLEQEVQT
jgi:predicted  nucleic acid-binding Zn-ribbon protein